jgi:hypothetical protein
MLLHQFVVAASSYQVFPDMSLNDFGRDVVLGSNSTFRVAETPFWVRNLFIESPMLIDPVCRCSWTGYKSDNPGNSSVQGPLFVSNYE